VAAFKAPDLVREFRNRGAEVAVVMTEAATAFVGPVTFRTLTGNPVTVDLFDRRGETALPAWMAGESATRMPIHLALAGSADLVVVAPATAATLSKTAHGIADNLLTTVLLATKAPVLMAPAMNSAMWLADPTRASLPLLEERGMVVMEPGTGKMAWDAEGEGPGRMPEPMEVASAAWALLEKSRSLAGVKVVVTAGRTEEPVDAVRVLSNRSSGRMGVALARAAMQRGAEVVLVAGGLSVPEPVGPRIIRATTAATMRDAVMAESADAGVLLMAAAVADWRPVRPATGKVKKATGPPEIELEPTDDILTLLRDAGGGGLRVGFALETEDALAAGQRKLVEKRLDLVVVNDATEPGAGFDTETNHVVLLARDAPPEDVPLASKRVVAERILDRVAELLDPVRVPF
jgi:phosphopantothenoylcysteine decarboxylase/phosphopantothenate--cysteine ligase